VNGPIASARKQAETNAVKGHCSVKTFAIRDRTVSYALVCGARVIESTAAYHGDRFDGVLTTTFEGKSTKTQVAARRTGACA